MGIVGKLSSDQFQFFNSQGYLVIESFASDEEIEAMMTRMHQLLDHFDPSSTASIFSTKNQQKLTDDYFFESVEKVSFFFEEKAFGDDGNLKQSKQLSINKVGHALHEIEPAFKKFSSSEKISSLMYSLGYKRPVVMQSMYIFKQPDIGGEVVPHQDNSFLYTEPQTCTGLWLALEDASIINGCLWAIPGSHKNGLVRRFLRDEDGVKFDRPSPSYDKKDFVPIEVKAGSLVVIHGDLIHQSFENQSPKSRHAYSFHIVDTDGCKWAPENWIRRKVEPEPLYVLPGGSLIHLGTLAMDFHLGDDERAWVIHPKARCVTYTGPVSFTEGISAGPTSRKDCNMTVEVPLPPARLLRGYFAETEESSTTPPLIHQGTSYHPHRS